MRYSKYWEDYELIDTSDGERLERWGDKILIRPDPQVIWKTNKLDSRWQNSNAKYHRSSTGGGHWELFDLPSKNWTINYKNYKFGIKLMNFKHTGIFPEQAVNWDLLEKIINKEKIKILNLFSYTGCSSVICAKSGANVCHVDASKGMVSWANENARLSNVEKSSIRWIVDDCEKFIAREIRRQNLYDGIIMDPPSYGRGPKGEIWKCEEKIFDFLNTCESLLSKNAKFLMINSYSTNFSPSLVSHLMELVLVKKRGGTIISDEIGIPVTTSKLVLPAGNTTIWMSETTHNIINL